MRAICLGVVLWSCGILAAGTSGGQGRGGSLLEELVALERSALDRWIRLDPQGYLDRFGPEVTYFDPTTDRRVDGLEAMRARLAPMKSMKPPFTDPRYEMIEPKVQRHGDMALLTFNLINYGKLAGQPESVLARWNATEAYARIDGKWRIVHSHWSFTKPDVKR
jgi:ketosteroid isomerase-like protein